MTLDQIIKIAKLLVDKRSIRSDTLRIIRSKKIF